MLHKQIVIVGGGPVGLSLALEIAGQGKSVVLIDQAINKTIDGRVLALSYASQIIINRLGAWPSSATPIDCVQISHAGLGISCIRAQQLQIDHLGYTVKYAELYKNLFYQVQQNKLIEIVESQVVSVHDNDNFATIEYLSTDNQPSFLTADLTILAEGGKLLTDKAKKINHDYQQQALVAHIQIKDKTKNIAYERFAHSGPLVLLPFADHYVVVWSLSNQVAVEFKNDPQKLCSSLNAEFAKRLGGATLLSPIFSFPLKLSQVKKRLRKRVVLIGNSAQTVHPVSAQGLNLGLRDAVMLSQLLAQSEIIDLEQLKTFDKLRDKDANAVIGFTHFLAAFLEKQGKLINHLRAAGLIALSNFPIAQNFIARSLIFGI